MICAESRGMIIGLSCLKRPQAAKQIKFNALGLGKPVVQPNKIVLFYDKAAIGRDEIKEQHVNGMKVFIEEVTKNKSIIPWVTEISESHQDSVRQANMLATPGNVLVQLALASKMCYKNIQFSSFDLRKNCDMWVRDMILQPEVFGPLFDQGHQFPPSFYQITVENFLAHLYKRHSETADLIEKLPISDESKQEYHSFSKKRYDDSTAIIDELSRESKKITHVGGQSKEHFFNLIRPFRRANNVELFFILHKENTFFVHLVLFQQMLHLSETNPLTIAYAGAYHSNNVEKALWSLGFEKDNCSMELDGLKMDDLEDIQYPSNVPDHFMNRGIKKFIAIDGDRGAFGTIKGLFGF